MPTRSAWLTGLVALLAALFAAEWLGLRQRVDRAISDHHWRLRAAARGTRFPSDVLVVAVDDRTVRRLGRLRNWSRARYAELLRRAASARVVGFDILFAEADRDPTGDRLLAQAIREHGRVVLAFHQPVERPRVARAELERVRRLMERMPPASTGAFEPAALRPAARFEPPLPELLDAAAAAGYVDVTADDDGVYRTPLLVQATHEGRCLPHFALAIACLAEGVSLADAVREAPRRLRIGDRTIPLRDGALTLQPVARRGEPEVGGRSAESAGRAISSAARFASGRAEPGAPVPTIRFVDALREPPATFASRIVLVGETASGTTDIRPTPLDAGLRGVEFNAEILANLLDLPVPEPLPLAAQAILVLAAGCAPLWLFSSVSPRAATAGSAATLLAALGVMEAGFWLAYLVPSWSAVLIAGAASTFAMGLQRLGVEEARRRQLRRDFALYVPPRLVAELERNPELIRQQGTRQRVAVLFSDVRGFTTYAERHPPEQVLGQMEAYLEEMTAAVDECDGVLDKYIGDGVMALFGPLILEPDANLSARAVLCALEMLERLERLNATWERQGLPPFRIGIGIHVGDAIVGQIRTSRRLQFTALGDTVNLASRLQTATKELRVPVLVSEAVRDESAPVLAGSVLFVDRGLLEVRGREQPVRVFEARRIAPAAGEQADETSATERLQPAEK